jgi:AraC family transcriptional regulator
MRPDEQKAHSRQLEEFVVREGGEWYRAAYSGNADSMFSAFWKLPAGKRVTDNLPMTVLTYVVKGFGSSTRTGEGKTLGEVARPGRLSLVTSDVCFRWHQEFAFEGLTLYLDSRKLGEFAQQNMDLAETPKLDNLFWANDPWLAGLCQMVLSNMRKSGSSDVEFDSLLLERVEDCVMHHLFEQHSELRSTARRQLEITRRPQELNPRLLRRVTEYIDANLGRSLSLAELAGVVFMSRHHFARCFKVSTGTPPHKYVLEARLSRAAHMLENSAFTVAAIALACGFNDQRNFSTAFRKHFKLPPTLFRRRWPDPSA